MKFLNYIALAAILSLSSCNDDSVIEEPVQNVEQTQNEAGDENPVLSTADTLPCIDVITKIVTTSSSYKKMTDGLTERIEKNGGTSYGIMLEASPNPGKDNSVAQSATYDFSLHESYPDRSPVIARYSFNPKTKQLYEYDVVNDSLVIIPFDKRLLPAINNCKN